MNLCVGPDEFNEAARRLSPAPHGDDKVQPEDCRSFACTRSLGFPGSYGKSSSSSKSEVPIVMPRGRGGKLYTVRKGYQVGIFTTWAKCEIHVKGYPGCEFRSFKLYEDAVRYLGFTPR
jgi:hypothetical protein